MSKKIFNIISLVLAFVFIVSVVQPAYTSNEGKMRVWVEFSPGRGARVEKSLNALGAEFHYRFEDLNSFVVTVPEQALGGLRNNPNVVSIEEDAIRYAYTDEDIVPYGVDMVQARDVWDKDGDLKVDVGAPTGAGIKVCIIDSGIYAGHEDFSGVNIYGGYTNIPGTSYTSDLFGHGTHVAGTITAQLNQKGVVGVTPGSVSLFIVKVFGDDGLWAYSSSLVDAANRCASSGAKIISMSLGGPTKNKTEERAFNTLYSQGILSIAAAGNDGTSAYNYPASYTSVVSVAAIDSNMTVADFSQFNSQVELAAPGVGVLSTVPYINTATLVVDGLSYSVNQMEFTAMGSATGSLVNGGLCGTGDSNWAGKVVLCQRGTYDFLVKVQSVQSSGGSAAVIYNNAPGNFLGTLGSEDVATIPAVSLSQEDGQDLIATKLGTSATVTTTSEKPASGYEAWDGTSMATPHVSGVAALIWSANPYWTNVQIRTALIGSAMDLGAGGRDVYYGYGLVQAKAALDLLGGATDPTPTPTSTPVTPTPTTPPPTPTPTPTTPPVSDTLAISIDTDKDIYSNNQRVYITVTVTDEYGAPVIGASVSGQIFNPSNALVASLTATTTTSGVVTFTYLVKRNVGTGTYTVSATASKSGYTSDSETITFTVK